MIDFRKLFPRHLRGRSADEVDSSYDVPRLRDAGLEVEYQRLIASHLTRFGVDPSCVRVAVVRTGQASNGFDVFIAHLRLERWARPSAPRLLLGLPLLESRVRQAVERTWLADVSHFAGLWLHAAAQLSGSGCGTELRELLAQVAQRTATGSTPGADTLREDADLAF